MLDTRESNFAEWWRWPLVPFAAIAGSLLGAIAFLLVQWLAMKMQGGFNEDGWMFRYILPVMQSAVFGYLYVLISCVVAPRGKFTTGVVMATLLFAFSALVVAVAWLKPPVDIGEAVQTTISTIAMGIAAIVALIQAHDAHR